MAKIQLEFVLRVSQIPAMPDARYHSRKICRSLAEQNAKSVRIIQLAVGNFINATNSS